MRSSTTAATLAAFLLSAVQAFGQGAVLQSGAITINHCAMWIANGIVADSGSACGTGGGGGVSSVGLTMPNWFSVGNSPITSSGSFNVTILPQVQSYVLAAPVGSNGVPTFRALQGADLPTPSAISAGGVYSIASTPHQWVSYISTAGIPFQSQPTFNDIGGVLSTAQLPLSGVTAGSYVNANVSINANGIITAASSGGGSGGSVSSVGLVGPPQFIITGSPVTSSGTLQIGLASQSSNTVWAGPSGGPSAAPGFRSLVLADLPTITSVGVVTAGTWNATPIANGYLANSSMTFGSQVLSLGATAVVQGNAGKVQLSTGATTAGHCVQFDSSGNTVDAGGACTTGGGGGTVSAGTAGQLAYYSGTGTAVVGNANATISSGAMTLGIAASVTGSLGLAGSTSGAVTIQPQAAAGTYNFNLPTSAGSANQVLTSQGGGGTAQTYQNVSALVGAGSGVVSAGTSSITLSAVLRGYIGGCTMSNDGSSPNTVIDTAACMATSDDATTNMVLAAFTKTSGAWTLGTGNGCLDTGVVGSNTWYSLFIVERPDTGVVDELCSTSATAPTMPANYTKKRRIGSFRTDGSGNILAFTQVGHDFLWATSVTDANSVTPPDTSAHMVTITVPSGVQVTARYRARADYASGSSGGILFTSPSETDQATPRSLLYGAAGPDAAGEFATRVNTSGQIRVLSNSVGMIYSIYTFGWNDPLL